MSRFLWLMGSSSNASASRPVVTAASSDVAIKDSSCDEDDGYGNAGLEIASEFVEVANREVINRELVNLENAAVNIDNSNDVIIGPVTQFNVNGNVTIYQNKDGRTVGLEGKPDRSDDVSNGQTLNYILSYSWIPKLRIIKRKNQLKLLMKLSLCVILLLCAALMLVAVIYKNKLQTTTEVIYGRTLGNNSIYYKSDWGGIIPRSTVRTPLPIGLIIVGHTDTRPCSDFEDCTKILRTLQEYHINSLGFNDVCENFLISRNGDVYVGRGWDTKNCYQKLSIGISFIGNFNIDKVTVNMITSFSLLIQQGLQLQKLPKEYIIVATNQTYNTYSPGANVFNVIKNFCHYSCIDLRNNPQLPHTNNINDKIPVLACIP